MIRKEEVFPIGTINKPHGVNGEMSFTFTTDVFDTAEAEYLIFEMDGILVPFFIESYRFRTDTTALIKLDDIDTEELARSFMGQTAYLPLAFREHMENEVLTLSHFIGFTLVDDAEGVLGTITDVDETTENRLFSVDYRGGELLIPANDDFVTDIDLEGRTIHMTLPEGLIDNDKCSVIDD